MNFLNNLWNGVKSIARKTSNVVKTVVIGFGAFALGASAARATDPDYSGLVTSAQTSITAGQTNAMTVIGYVLIAAGVFIVFKWIRKAMNKA